MSNCTAQKCVKSVFALQEMMPLQYIYTMALEQDIKNSVTSRKTSELLQNRCYQVRMSNSNMQSVLDLAHILHLCNRCLS